MTPPAFSRRGALLLALSIGASVSGAAAQTPDPLPSWNESHAKRAILSFVDAVTREGSGDFVPPAERIATFDNDGTLWTEQPAYAQAAFLVDRMKALAPLHPQWKKEEPYRSVLEKGLGGLAGANEATLARLVAATHDGTTPAAFRAIVAGWLADARHPRFGRPYTDLVYKPMREVIELLHAKGFKTYVVSGGGAEFMRAFMETTYGVPPERVIGSRVKTVYVTRSGRAELFREGEVEFVNDGKGKPVAIEQAIGRRPIAAFGNSDGDLEMLQWTTQAGGRRLAVVVHHTDAEREYAYDRKSNVGKLDLALDAARMNGWAVVDMKTDWKVIFPFQQP
ncbi:MAG: haloacid dehalogenase [Hyphomicrobiales bacterium]|nr:haloacid dehalogenase [Hyphomicrobiales bacterium]